MTAVVCLKSPAGVLYQVLSKDGDQVTLVSAAKVEFVSNITKARGYKIVKAMRENVATRYGDEYRFHEDTAGAA